MQHHYKFIPYYARFNHEVCVVMSYQGQRLVTNELA
jgi:hypothetical protein